MTFVLRLGSEFGVELQSAEFAVISSESGVLRVQTGHIGEHETGT